MSVTEIKRVINGFERDIYSEPEFFCILALRTSPHEVAIAYELILSRSKQAFAEWIRDQYSRLALPGVVLSNTGERPNAETIVQFHRLVADDASD